MAFHIFNCSVDTPDPLADNIPEDLSFNDIESFVELVLEEGLHIENAIPEHNEFDDNYQMDWFVAYKSFKMNSNRCYTKANNTFQYRKQYSKQIHSEIISPPPKA